MSTDNSLVPPCSHPESTLVHLEVIDPSSFGTGGMRYDWCQECGALIELYEGDEGVHLPRQQKRTAAPHTLWIRLEIFDELKGGASVRVSFRESTKRPTAGDIVEVRGRHADEPVWAVVDSVEQDDDITTHLSPAWDNGQSFDRVGDPHLEQAEFKCPECGSHEFGTVMEPPPSTTYCHGPKRCRFSCLDAERWRCFELRGKPFTNQAQYDAHVVRWLGELNERNA